MAEKIKNFGGFKVIDGSAAGFNLSGLADKTVIYFVRTDAGKEDGFIYFNGKKYGTGKLSSKAVQDELTKLSTKVETHIANQATVNVTARTSGATDDNGALSVNDSAKWLSGAAIEKIKTYVDSEDVKSMELVGTEIQLKNKAGAVLAKLNASDFIKDGMLESVTLVDDETKGKVLQFTWNTDSGKKSTPIEVSEFFHEISGDTNTITVTQPSSGKGSLQISAKTVASVDGVTSSATALMTGGITQQYVAQEINKLDSTLPLSATTNSVTYATAKIVQTDGKLNKTGSSLVLNVATGLNQDHAGFVYNSTAHTFTVKESAFAKQGLLDAQDVITLLRNNNTNIANALTYLNGQIPTVKGGNYINVNKNGTEYIVSANEDLTAAISNANNAVQSVNYKMGTNVVITGEDIKIGRTIQLPQFEPIIKQTDTLNDTFFKILTSLGAVSLNTLQGVKGSGSITVSEKSSNQEQKISVKAKSLSETEKAAGQIEIITTGTTGIYGLLYFGGDDVEE